MTFDATDEPPWGDEIAAERDAIEGEGGGYPRATSEQLQRDAIVAAKWEGRVVQLDPEWISVAPPARSWLLRDKRTPCAEGVFPLGKSGLLIGEGGVSKTMAVLQLAVAVATGSDWLGAFSVMNPGPVLVLLGEEDLEEVRRRTYAATRLLRSVPQPGSLVFLPLSGTPCAFLERDSRYGSVRESEFLGWLRKYVASREWRLIVADPLSRFAGPEAEKDNEQATRFVQVVESLAKPGITSTLVCHHTNQNSRGKAGTVDATSGRGVTGLHDGFRWQASLENARADLEDEDEHRRLSRTVRFKFNKSNYSREFDPVMLRRGDGGVLIPLDASDLDILGKAHDGTNKELVAEAKQQAERDRIDAVVVAIVAEKAGIYGTQLRVETEARAHVGEAKANKAIARVAVDKVRVDDVRSDRKRYWPKGVQL
jgi:RecA-family ATPase